MEIMEAIERRHSVREYTNEKIQGEVLQELLDEIALCNEESGLNIQLITDEPDAFSGKLAHYGDFKGVKNYLALVGKKADDLQEKCGYYGQKIVIKAQMLGLNTCWVMLTYNKSKVKKNVKIEKDEKLVCVIAIGYGENQGKPHSNCFIDSIFRLRGDMPSWFMEGIQCALFAPTAMNQQKFRFILVDDNKVKAENRARVCGEIDLGIAKYHFEIGAGDAEFEFV